MNFIEKCINMGLGFKCNDLYLGLHIYMFKTLYIYTSKLLPIRV